MSSPLITKEDLFDVERRLMAKLERITAQLSSANALSDQGIKTKDARRMLRCCNNTLSALHIQGKLRMKKIGGANYYHPEDIQQLILQGF